MGRPKSGELPCHEPLIVIGPRSVTRRIVHLTVNAEIMAFRSLAELDRWRARKTGDAIGPDVEEALEVCGIDRQDAAPSISSLLDHLATLPAVPSLHYLFDGLVNRRTLYRLWRQLGNQTTPARFLELVRFLHARRLIVAGANVKNAALLAGYSAPEVYCRAAKRFAQGGHESSSNGTNTS